MFLILKDLHKDLISAAEIEKGHSKPQTCDFKYGIEVPKNYIDIKRIDKASGNTKWQDAVTKEVGELIHHNSFKLFMPKDFKPPQDYHYCCLHFVYEVKVTYARKLDLFAMVAELILECFQLGLPT